MTDLTIANYFFGFVIAKVWGVEGLQRFVGKEIVQAFTARGYQIRPTHNSN